MKTFCAHHPHKVIADILECKYLTDQVLIATHKIPEHIEDVLIKFVKCAKYPDWYWFSAKRIRQCKTQPNGRGTVYCVPMSVREDFIPITKCEHQL